MCRHDIFAPSQNSTLSFISQNRSTRVARATNEKMIVQSVALLYLCASSVVADGVLRGMRDVGVAGAQGRRALGKGMDMHGMMDMMGKGKGKGKGSTEEEVMDEEEEKEEDPADEEDDCEKTDEADEEEEVEVEMEGDTSSAGKGKGKGKGKGSSSTTSASSSEYLVSLQIECDGTPIQQQRVSHQIVSCL
jgi:hypothetical protein